jgi:hypothetical protein
MRRLLLLGFWNLLCRGCAILLLARGGRLDLLLRRVLVRGFRRFVTHSSNPKVQNNWCQFCKQRASHTLRTLHDGFVSSRFAGASGIISIRKKVKSRSRAGPWKMPLSLSK